MLEAFVAQGTPFLLTFRFSFSNKRKYNVSIFSFPFSPLDFTHLQTGSLEGENNH